jgi:hypothetical protein
MHSKGRNRKASSSRLYRHLRHGPGFGSPPSILLEVEISLDFIAGQRSIVSFRFPAGDTTMRRRIYASRGTQTGVRFTWSPPIWARALAGSGCTYSPAKVGACRRSVQFPKRLVTQSVASVLMRSYDGRPGTQGMEPFRRVWNFFCDQTKLFPRDAELPMGRQPKWFASPQTGAGAAPSPRRFGAPAIWSPALRRGTF